MATLLEQVRRGHLLSRAWGRALREMRSLTTTVVLSGSRPTGSHAAIVTLNADEENATVQAVLLGDAADFDSITLVTPSPEISKIAVGLAARRLERSVPPQLTYRQLSYRALLGEYKRASETYSTHVLLPGRDLSKKRRHVHLTHGSGPKPDTTFRGPTNVLASITPQWVPQQLREYKLPADTEVIEYMPRLEIMRLAVGDRSVLERLGLDVDTEIVVWAPTYRKAWRGTELRVTGSPLGRTSSEDQSHVLRQIEGIAQTRGATLVLKTHPQDADTYSTFDVTLHTNDSLRQCNVTPYELFGVASLLITDYSSVYLERDALGLQRTLFQPDRHVFEASARGLRYSS